MNPPSVVKTDLETGPTPTSTLYPKMSESPDLRWSFIRKVYSIVTIQLLLTVAVAALVVSYHPIVTFLTTTKGGLVSYIIIIITPFISKFYDQFRLVFDLSYCESIRLTSLYAGFVLHVLVWLNMLTVDSLGFDVEIAVD